MSLRLRVTLWYLATLFLLLTLFVGYFFARAYWTFLNETDKTLQLAADQAQPYVTLGETPRFQNPDTLLQVMNRIDSDLTLQIVATDGHVYDRLTNDNHHFLAEGDSDSDNTEGHTNEERQESSSGLEGSEEAHGREQNDDMRVNIVVPLPALDKPYSLDPFDTARTFTYNGVTWRASHHVVFWPSETTQNPESLADRAIWLQAIQPVEHVDVFYENQLALMLWAIPLALLLAGLGGYWLAVRTLRPISQMTQTAATISTQALGQRIGYQGVHDELGQLAHTFDAMLDRLQEGFERERRFVSDASHELRTPLTVLKGNIEIALSRPRQPETYVDFLSELGSQVDRLVRLSNGLLFMARFDYAQHQNRSMRLVNIDDLLLSVLDQVRSRAVQKEIQLETMLGADDDHLYGDLDLLIRLFLNLLDNAIKYTPSGGTVTISTAIQPQHLCITIQDTGPGIPPEHHPRLFDRFYRVEQARVYAQPEEQGSGAGLGLAIAQEIAKAHDGAITVDSTPPHGATFIVRFTLAK